MDQQQVKSRDFVAALATFFQRDLISIPVIKKYPHQAFAQRCNLKAATLELDTAAYPNIEYIAGNRLSVYPINPSEQVALIMKHLVDDVSQALHGTTASAAPAAAAAAAAKRAKSAGNSNSGGGSARLSEPWAKFVALNGRESVRLALTYIYDITSPPTRDLLRLMAENCSRAEHRKQLISISRTEESWEKWICQGMHTLRSTFDEYPSCTLSAKSLFSELTLQQPRQYSISSIKSSKRFRAEIIVFQHHFSSKQISNSLQRVKELERSLNSEQKRNNNGAPGSPAPPKHSIPLPPTTVHVNHNVADRTVTKSNRSLRSMINPTTYYSTSPISRQQVSRVPNYAGPLMSMYASSTALKSSGSSGSRMSRMSLRDNQSVVSAVRQQLDNGGSGIGATSSTGESGGGVAGKTNRHQKLYEGLCSNYLLALNNNDHILCEFVENPRFTLKGNRERPIMMIGQDIGLIAYRSFWQQRSLEHDRAQVFYTLFKDLAPKKFGDMQLVCLTGDRCRLEDMFKREISQMLTTKIISSFTCINRNQLKALYESAAISSQTGTSGTGADGGRAAKLVIESRELIELGARIARLLIENNGCLYTCCDAQMTQAIEILAVESIARNGQMSREQIMTLLPKWKGRLQNSISGKGKQPQQPQQHQKETNDKQQQQQFLFTIENQFERAQVVEEIYDSSI